MGFWVKNGILEENGRAKGTFGSKIGSLGKMAVQIDFWVKNGVLWGNGHAKGFWG